jgi:hypothetical protein
MQYNHRPEVNETIAERSKANIEAVNKWFDEMRGTMIGVKVLSSGQPRPYADSVTDAIIYCVQPNVLTTNAPVSRVISRDVAKELARIFLCASATTLKESSEAGAYETRIDRLTPQPDACGLEEHAAHTAKGLSSCWRVVIRSPYCD